jgi:hypothetical protein
MGSAEFGLRNAEFSYDELLVPKLRLGTRVSKLRFADREAELPSLVVPSRAWD